MSSEERFEQALRTGLADLAAGAPVVDPAAVRRRLRRRTAIRTLWGLSLPLAAAGLALLLGHAQQAGPTREPVGAPAEETAAPAIPAWSPAEDGRDRSAALASLLGSAAVHISGTVSKHPDGTIDLALVSDGPCLSHGLEQAFRQALASYRSAQLVVAQGHLQFALFDTGSPPAETGAAHDTPGSAAHQRPLTG